MNNYDKEHKCFIADVVCDNKYREQEYCGNYTNYAVKYALLSKRHSKLQAQGYLSND